MNRSRKFLVLLCTVIVLAAMVGCLFHQHHADESLLECQICQLIFQSVFLAALVYVLTGVVKKESFFLDSDFCFSSLSLISGLQNRAPPPVLS